MAAKKIWQGRVCVERGRDGTRPDGQPKYRERYEFVGRFDTKRERDAAVARRRLELEDELEQQAKRRADPGAVTTWNEYIDRYLERARVELKDSSYDTARATLRAFAATSVSACWVRSRAPKPKTGPRGCRRRKSRAWWRCSTAPSTPG
jgi:hypothetical protein